MAAAAELKRQRKLERAATYEETTVSQFVLSNAVAADLYCERMVSESLLLIESLDSHPNRIASPREEPALDPASSPDVQERATRWQSN